MNNTLIVFVIFVQFFTCQICPLSGCLCPMKAEKEQSVCYRRAGLLFNIVCSYEQGCEFVCKMFRGFDAGGDMLMGFGKTLDCVSLENIFEYISTVLSSCSLFFSASFRLNAKYLFSLQISFDYQLLLLHCCCCYFLHTTSQLTRSLYLRSRRFLFFCGVEAATGGVL